MCWSASVHAESREEETKWGMVRAMERRVLSKTDVSLNWRQLSIFMYHSQVYVLNRAYMGYNSTVLLHVGDIGRWSCVPLEKLHW